MPGDSGGTQDSKTTVQLPTEIENASNSFAKRALKASKTPYQAYDGQRIADLNSDELAAFDLTRNSTGNWNDALTKSSDLAGIAGQQWSNNVAQNYMNPYQKNVTDIAARELVKSNDVAMKGLNSNMAASGAFGGAQAGVQSAAMQKNLEQSLGDLYATNQAKAYDNALSAFNADRSAALGASSQYGNLASEQSALSGEDIDRLLTSGAAQQKQTQAGLDQAYQDWQDKQNWEWTQLNKGTSILGGLPYGQTQNSSSSSSNPGQLMNTGISAGAGIAAAGLIVL